MFINLKNDFKVNREIDKTAKPDNQITQEWIIYVIQKGYAGGMSSDKRRMFVTINDKIESAVEADEDYLELNPIEYQFVKTAFDNAIVEPKWAAAVTVVENAVFAATPEKPVSTPTDSPGGVVADQGVPAQ